MASLGVFDAVHHLPPCLQNLVARHATRAALSSRKGTLACASPPDLLPKAVAWPLLCDLVLQSPVETDPKVLAVSKIAQEADV